MNYGITWKSKKKTGVLETVSGYEDMLEQCNSGDISLSIHEQEVSYQWKILCISFLIGPSHQHPSQLLQITKKKKKKQIPILHHARSNGRCIQKLFCFI
jgi:glucose-6-phosphate 1-dehydrogenase